MLTNDLAFTFSGVCYTFKIIAADDYSAFKSGKEKQLTAFASGDIYGADIVLRLQPGDFDFWNTTLYSGYYLVPWIGGGSSPALEDSYFNPLEITDNCYKAYNMSKASYSSTLKPLTILFSAALY